eukprot:gnl/TRDRNA2_/TRDRNA2_178828_c0_seq1.p1 gnl/TRDRNA2_/TRDRNA2_178828_c0~~gnl/TRDRNA2_/TRDRNA2_178828_c0_seq1.p1  ORF type:complete len:215 (+),score=49.41 gnl/TRDRNA2_/TRDRNA2_178828_c0_seq1:71-646(+)
MADVYTPEPEKVKTVKDVIIDAALDREAALDEKIKKYDNMKEDDLEELRRKRLERMKSQHKSRQDNLALGHGQYEIVDEKDFFAVAKKSSLVVVHFWRKSNSACEILEKHLRDTAHKHVGTRFVGVNAEKAPYLTEKLHIWMLPSLVLCKNGRTDHTIVGLDEFGGVEDFDHDDFELILAKYGMIPREDDE